MGGTLTVDLDVMRLVVVRLLLLFGVVGGVERVGCGSDGLCTLLGPEGPGFLGVVGWLVGGCWGWGFGSFCGVLLPVGWGVGAVGQCRTGGESGLGWCRSYVENYTVDASIFDTCRG